MFDESPPPYSAVVATPSPLGRPLESPNATLPFSDADDLAAKILSFVSEGKTLDSRFKDIRDVASMGTEFEYQSIAIALCERFEKLVWETRSVASVALVAVKEFNEIILDFLSEPDVAAQDRLDELTNASKLLKRERDSAAAQKSSFDSLIKETEDFHRMLHTEPVALSPQRMRQCPNGSATSHARPSWISRPPFVVKRSEPLSGLSATTVSIGAILRTGMDYGWKVENSAEKVVFPWCASAQPAALDASSVALHSMERKRLWVADERAELAALPGTVEAFVRDLRVFASRVDVFNTVFAELAREQDIFFVYLKDGQSITNVAYRSEIKRLRKHLPCVCNALDVYSKGKVS